MIIHGSFMRIGKNHVSGLCRNGTGGLFPSGFFRLVDRAALFPSLLFILDTLETKRPLIQHQRLITILGYFIHKQFIIKDMENIMKRVSFLCLFLRITPPVHDFRREAASAGNICQGTGGVIRSFCGQRLQSFGGGYV